MMNFSNQSSLLPLLLIIWIRIRVHKVAEYGSNFSLDHWLEHFFLDAIGWEKLINGGDFPRRQNHFCPNNGAIFLLSNSSIGFSFL